MAGSGPGRTAGRRQENHRFGDLDGPQPELAECASSAGGAAYTRKELDGWQEWAKARGGKGIAWLLDNLGMKHDEQGLDTNPTHPRSAPAFSDSIENIGKLLTFCPRTFWGPIFGR